MQSQQEGTEQPETNLIVYLQEKQAGAINSKVVSYYKLFIECEPEESYPEVKPVNQVQKEEDPMKNM